MYATSIRTHQNGSTQVAPPTPRPRSGDDSLPEEAIYGRASHAARQPEAALMCAILQDAVESFQSQFVSATPHAKRLSQEAERWLFSDDCRWIFSFLPICDALDLCPQYIRQGLKCWYERSPQSRKQPAPSQSLESQSKSILLRSADNRVHVSASRSYFKAVQS